MEHYAGIDVSLEFSSVCVVDAQGKIVREVKVASEPEALVAFFASLGFAVKRVGLEAGPLSQWLHAVLKRAGFDTLLLETRHVKAALSAMMVKTDRKDARGLGQLIRMGWFRPVHAKSMAAVDVFKPPKNLFQLKYEYLTAQGTGSTPGSIATVTTDQIRLRLDHRIDLSQQSLLVLRGDLRVVAKDPITASNPSGDYLYGLGDTDIQGVYAYNFDSRWPAGFGSRLIAPTGGDTLGSGKWQVLPIAGFRYRLSKLIPKVILSPMHGMTLASPAILQNETSAICSLHHC